MKETTKQIIQIAAILSSVFIPIIYFALKYGIK